MTLRSTVCTVALAVVAALAPATATQAAAAPPTPAAAGDTAGPAVPEGWRVLRTPAGYEVVNLPVERRPVTDARPHVATASADLGPARTRPDGSLVVTTRTLPDDLATLTVRYGAATEAQLLGQADRTRRGAEDPAPAPAASPGIVTATYTGKPLPLAGMTHPADVSARVVAPATGTNLPVVLFLHGRHQWCDGDGWEWPCVAPSKPVPNMEGYRYVQEDLARRGYFTVSIDANAINAQDNETPDLGMSGRSALVRTHLALLASWKGGASAPFASTIRSRYDMGRTMLVGHSRGGEGVAYAAIEQNPGAGYHVSGLLLLGPTNFFHTSASTTPTVTVVPGCDGDVSDLQGAGYADAAEWYGPRHALSTLAYLPGANHNFFNTEWTPPATTGSDDGEWTGCKPASRLTAARQRQAGAALIATTADRFLKGTGDPAAVDGTGAVPADQRWMRLVTSGTGGARQRLAQPGQSGWTVAGATLCTARTCAPTTDGPVGVHWRGLDGLEPQGWRWDLARSGTFTLTPAAPVSLRGSAYVDVRMVLSPDAVTAPLLRLTDTSGHRVHVSPLGAATLAGVRGPADAAPAGRWIARTVRFALPSTGVDLSRVASAALVRGGKGSAVVLDLAAARPGTAPAGTLAHRILRLPRQATVKEGDKPWTYSVPGTLSSPVAQPMVATSVVFGNGTPAYTTRAVPPGATSVPLPVAIKGDTSWSPQTSYFGEMGVRGPVLVATPGTYVQVTEDDAKVRATVTPAATAAPGGALTWKVTIDRASTAGDVDFYARAVPATPSLRVSDIAPAAREEWGVYDPEAKDADVDQAGVGAYVFIPAGSTTGTFTMPLAPTAVVGHRTVLELHSDAAELPAGATLTGTVVAK